MQCVSMPQNNLCDSTQLQLKANHNHMKYFIGICLIIYCCLSCTSYRIFTNNIPHYGDMKCFPYVEFPASSTPNPFPTKYYQYNFSPDFQKFLRTHHTTALLVIQNDTIRLEYYAPTICSGQSLELFSISKSIVASIMSIACEEGYISSVKDKLGDYLSHLPQGYENITLEDLLNMRSGIKTTLYHSAWLYYSSNLKRSLYHISISSCPGNTYSYNNADTQWLIAVIEEATRQKFCNYFYQKLWIPLHTEYAGSWSIDSRKHNTARGFCGLNISLRDLARLGICFLKNGQYEGHQLLPASWLQRTFSPSLEEKSNTDDFIYHMHWRIITPQVEFLAKGLFGQYMYINKAKNSVVIRLGSNESSVAWIPFFRRLLTSSTLNSFPYPDFSNACPNNN